MKKILIVNDFTQLATGFAKYGKDVLQYLHAAGYEVAELALYLNPQDPRIRNVPWTVYANLPHLNETGQPLNQDEANSYHSNNSNAFGAWKINDVLLDFKPDVVLNCLDPWMILPTLESPLRKHFNLLIMPTVDSAPQQQQWVDLFCQADGCFTWSKFGTDTLEKEGSYRLNLLGDNACGPDFKIFKPVPDKRQLKQSFGLSPDMKIIGTVQRNQHRKLFPDLFKAFRLYLDKYPSLADETYLYCHTSWPDLGWALDDLIKEHQIGNKVLFTYLCKNCQAVFPAFWGDNNIACPRCKQLSAILPNTQVSIDESILSAIYNCMDLYVQLSIAEGLGVPLLEAAACAIPVMAVKHTAMDTVISALKGTHIDVKHYFLEPQTRAIRCYPDIEDLTAKWYQFFSKPEIFQRRAGMTSHDLVRKHFNPETVGQRWVEAIESLSPKSWNGAPYLVQPSQQVPNNLSNWDFVGFCIRNVWGRPEYLNSYLHSKAVSDLNLEVVQEGVGVNNVSEESFFGQIPRMRPFSRQDCYNRFVEMANFYNYWEQRRVGMIPHNPITYKKGPNAI